MTLPPRIVVTRPAHQAGGLARALEEAGFRTELLPLLEVTGPEDPGPLHRAVGRLEDFDLVFLTSANAVPPLVEALQQRPAARATEAGRATGGRPVRGAPGLRWPRDVELGVIGPATARATREAGLPVDRRSERADAEGLVELLGAQARGRKFLLPQAADARPTLAEGLREAGGEVTVVVAYDKRQPPDAGVRARELFGSPPSPGTLGWVTFTSPRIVRHFVELVDSLGGWEERRDELLALSIGPVTTRELERFGAPRIVEAESPGNAGLAAAAERNLDDPARETR